MAFFTMAFITLSIAVPYVIYKELGAQPLSFDNRLLSWPVLGIGCLLLAMYFCCDGLRLHHTLKALGQELPKRHLGKLVFINILFSNITPMATGGGFAQIWYLRRYGVPFGTATAASTMRTLLSMAFIFTLTPILVLFMPFFQGNDLIARSGAYFGLFALAYLCFFAVVLLRIRWIIMITDIVLMSLHRYRLIGQDRLQRWRFGARREMIRFSRGMKAYLNGPKTDILLSIFYTALFLLALFSFPSLLLWGLDYHLSYLTTTGLLLVATFIMYFSPTPGGSGFAEGVFGLFFASVVNPTQLLLVIVVWRFLTIYLGMLVGVPVTLREMTRKEPCGA